MHPLLFGGDLVATLLLGLIIAILNAALFFVNDILLAIVPTALNAEKTMDNLLGVSIVSGLFNYFYGIGMSLLVLKFLVKGFNTYVLWTDGDPDSDPTILLTGFVSAMAFAISFPTIYGWLSKIINDSSIHALALLSGTSENELIALTGFASGGLFTAIVSLIFIILFLILYIQFLTRGLEIMILRIGLPLACVGLMDADKGMFKPYTQKFYQSTIAVLVQIILAKLGVAFMINTHIFWGLACILLALRTPKFLQEFLLVSGGGVNTGTIYQTARLGQMAKNFLNRA